MGRTALGMLQEVIISNNREIDSCATTNDLVQTISSNVVQQTEEMVWLQENQQKIKEYTDKVVYEQCEELDWYKFEFTLIKESIVSYAASRQELEEIMKEKRNLENGINEFRKKIENMSFIEKIIHGKKIKRFKQFLEFCSMMNFMTHDHK